MIRPKHKRTKLLISGSAILLVIAVGAGIYFLKIAPNAPPADMHSASDTDTKAKADPVAVAPQTPAAPTFNATQYSTTDASSLWVVVNKQHPLLPIDYAPTDLTTAYGHQMSARVLGDLNVMVGDAAAAGAHLTVVSAYRSYQYQVGLYNSYVAADGQQKADTYSARPGFSEHQTGLAIDFGDSAGTCSVESCYADTTEGKWLAENAYKYGFLLRYTAAEQSVTGYEAEAWHYRYVGRELALQLHDTNVATLEMFFGISGGETYVTTR